MDNNNEKQAGEEESQEKLQEEFQEESQVKNEQQQQEEEQEKQQEEEQEVYGDAVLEEVLSLLHAQTGHRFSHYKKNTIQRRIERQMGVKSVQRLDDYLQCLRHDPQEIEVLFRDLLIGVTSFFRDPESFEALKEKVVPLLFQGKNSGDPVRVWVPGCSTGEEAYSIAILLQEQLEAVKQNFMVTIFATDIDNKAIEKARRGVYPASKTADVSPERIKKYFIKNEDEKTYQVKKIIRDKLVFAEQNVSEDPSFSSLDLISCRNLLIFMDCELQKKVINQFHYSLNQEGYLFLGNAETVGRHEDLFDIVDLQHRIYKHNRSVSLKPVMHWAAAPPREGIVLPNTFYNAQEVKGASTGEIIKKALLTYYTPACVGINEQGEILYIHGRIGKYLEPVPGEVNLNFFYMVREGLRIELSAAIRKVISRKESVYIQGLRVSENGGTGIVNITVRPIFTEQSSILSVIMVLFHEVQGEGAEHPEEIAAAIDMTCEKDERIAELEMEHRRREEYLQNMAEELKNAYGELQSTQEEYQSTYEELKTSREELRSVNEELMTVNAELQEKIESLTQANNDIHNMLACTGVGTVFVDQKCRIKGFTPSATRCINLIKTDIGRPLGDITLNLKNYHRLQEDVQEVLDTLQKKDILVQTRGGLYYLMRILPYRTLENAVEGVVINFVGEQELLQDLKNRLNIIVRNSRDAITVQDFEGRISVWNPAAEKMYGWSEEEALLMNISDTIPEHKREEILKMISQLAQDRFIDTFQTQRLTKDGRLIEVSMTATSLVNQQGEVYAIATTERYMGNASPLKK